MTEIPFSKYSGCGNDFILINNRGGSLCLNEKTIENLCDRRHGIGADGIILLESGRDGSDFGMRIFNRDGSEAEMCGNGLRCLGQFIYELGFNKKHYRIKTKERHLSIDFTDGLIKADMGDAVDLNMDLEIEIEKNLLTCCSLNTGVPHAVVFVEDIKKVPVSTFGREIRHHAHFSPAGTNANFVQKTADNQIAIRTFERGVEDETLACGTGAAACAIAASLKWKMKTPIEVLFFSGEKIKIAFTHEGKAFTQITQTGPALKTFHGVFDMIGYL